MAIPWSSIKSLLIFFGPIIVPRALSYYRSVRNAPRVQGLAVRPLPPKAARSLAILFVIAVLFLIKTIPILAPENVFTRTQSRLQIPTDVLFTRLSALRPNNSLTPQDEALRARFVNLESRLLYLQFGPDVLANCPFCAADEPRSYLYYALPALAWPHLLNLVVLALVTSTLVSGREGAQWRTTATIAAVAVGLADAYAVSVYPYQGNARALRLAETDFFFWRARTYRHLALAGLDALLGWLLWLSATNRAFASPPSTAERLESLSRALASVKSKISAAGIVKNTASRDEELRGASQVYWNHEVRMMGEVMEEREVIEGVNDALQNRVNMEAMSRDADTYANAVLEPLQSTFRQTK